MSKKSLYPRGIGILWAICLFLFTGCAGVPVIKMPEPRPDIVKEYKSFKLQAWRTGMLKTGIRVTEGDFITIMAKGKIYSTFLTKFIEMHPSGNISMKVGEEGDFWPYSLRSEFNGRTVRENGEILLRNLSAINPPGSGSFDVDIIVWKKEDPVQISNFLEELSLKDPNNETLKDFAQDFKTKKEIFLAENKATKEVEETKQAIIALGGERIQEEKGAEKEKQAIGVTEKELQEKATQAIKTFKQKEGSGIKDPEKEKQVADLNEKLQKALQSLESLEEMKKKVAEQKKKEEELMVRLQQMEAERLKQSLNLPVIAIASPSDGASVEDEYISLIGVAEHGKGIEKLEILVNSNLVKRSDPRALQVVPKEMKRIEFAERIRLRDGKNEISIIAQSTEGLKGTRTFSVQLDKKKGEVWAAVIGINKYKNLPSLKYSVNDAREFYRYLLEVNQVPKENIWLLLDEEANLDKIRSVLGTHLRRKAGKDDMVIIYLAGHGATERDSASLDGDGLEKYILPHNADPKDLYSSAIPMNEVARIFQRISSERLVFISDTCYSGASGGRTVAMLGARANLSGGFLDRLSHGKGRVILTASDANEISVEKDELQHGVFTYYLLEALRGKGDLDGNGIITFDEVYRYVSLKVPQATGQEQHPIKKGEMKGEIILGVVR